MLLLPGWEYSAPPTSLPDAPSPTPPSTSSSKGTVAVLGDSLPFYEFERTWRVSPKLLSMRVDLQQPWSIVQAYFDDLDDPTLEHSIRLIPARGIAVERTKTITYNGTRLKTSDELNYSQGLERVLHAPRVATKERHLVVDDWGRAWLVDHFQDIDVWVAETEFDTEADMNALAQKPIWLEAEATSDWTGYTRNRAYERGTDELLRVIEYARTTGSVAMYLPGEVPDFRWSQAPGLRAPNPRSK